MSLLTEISEARFHYEKDTHDVKDLRKALVHMAAVCIAMIESIDRNNK